MAVCKTISSSSLEQLQLIHEEDVNVLHGDIARLVLENKLLKAEKFELEQRLEQANEKMEDLKQDLSQWTTAKLSLIRNRVDVDKFHDDLDVASVLNNPQMSSTREIRMAEIIGNVTKAHKRVKNSLMVAYRKLGLAKMVFKGRNEARIVNNVYKDVSNQLLVAMYILRNETN